MEFWGTAGGVSRHGDMGHCRWNFLSTIEIVEVVEVIVEVVEVIVEVVEVIVEVMGVVEVIEMSLLSKSLKVVPHSFFSQPLNFKKVKSWVSLWVSEWQGHLLSCRVTAKNLWLFCKTILGSLGSPTFRMYGHHLHQGEWWSLSCCWFIHCINQQHDKANHCFRSVDWHWFRLFDFSPLWVFECHRVSTCMQSQISDDVVGV